MRWRIYCIVAVECAEPLHPRNLVARILRCPSMLFFFYSQTRFNWYGLSFPTSWRLMLSFFCSFLLYFNALWRLLSPLSCSLGRFKRRSHSWARIRCGPKVFMDNTMVGEKGYCGSVFFFFQMQSDVLMLICGKINGIELWKLWYNLLLFF